MHTPTQYTCQLWDHFASKGGQPLEAMQKCICKVCLKMWDLDYNTTLQLLSLPPLSVHCDYLKVITVYNIDILTTILAYLCKIIPLTIFFMHVAIIPLSLM